MSCTMLRGIVQIGCYATFAGFSRQFCKYGSKGNFHDHNLIMVNLDPFCLFPFKKEGRITVRNKVPPMSLR